MIYLPLRYTVSAKYPRLWFVDQLVFVDMLLLVCATSRSPHDLFVRVLVIPLLVLSFMCIYELGYYENDMLAAREEAKPSLTPRASSFVNYRPTAAAWLWGGCLFLAALAAGSSVDGSLKDSRAWDLGCWTAALVSCRLVFYIYNRLDVSRRSYLYFALQCFKYTSVFLIFRPSLIGGICVTAQILTLSTIYWVYRLGGEQKRVERESLRLTIFLGASIPIFAATFPPDGDSGFAISLVCSWLLLRLMKPVFFGWNRRRRGR